MGSGWLKQSQTNFLLHEEDATRFHHYEIFDKNFICLYSHGQRRFRAKDFAKNAIEDEKSENHSGQSIHPGDHAKGHISLNGMNNSIVWIGSDLFSSRLILSYQISKS